MRFRDHVTDALQWQPARDTVKYAVHWAAAGRGRFLDGRPAHGTPLIVAAGPPKSGSQWVKALFDHEEVRRRTGLLTLPQLDYKTRLDRRLPTGAFVPGLYVSYPEYLRIPKHREHRCIYVVRDPRELVVSAYFSYRESHRLLGGIAEVRATLQQLSTHDGLLHTIELMTPHLQDMATWADVTDPCVLRIRLEHVNAEPAEAITAMLVHCGVTLEPPTSERVVADLSRERLQQRDLERRSAGAESHYRVRRVGADELFGAEHDAALERAAPGLAAALGYSA